MKFILINAQFILKSKRVNIKLKGYNKNYLILLVTVL